MTKGIRGVLFFCLTVATAAYAQVPQTGKRTAVPEPAAAPVSALSANEIQQAIDWGMGKLEIDPWASPGPYPLKDDPDGELTKLAGRQPVVLTPFVRVAIAARMAKEAYRSFGPRDVPIEAVEPVTWIVAFPYKDPFATSPVNQHIAVERIVILPTGSKDPAQAIQPAWEKTDVATLKNAFGLTVQTAGKIAAFPLDAFSTGRDIVVVFASPLYASVPAEIFASKPEERLAREIRYELTVELLTKIR